jgi:MoxR-like ATPase
MSNLIARPKLALAGYDLVMRAWNALEIETREAYVRKKVLARAQPLLARASIEAAPQDSAIGAIRASENLLSHHEKGWATAWFRAELKDTARDALLDLLYGKGSLEDRADQFLKKSARREIEGGAFAFVNTTTVTYLLGMADPRTYAFAKPASAFLPAKELLCSGEEHDTEGARRVSFATAMYRELGDLWARERGFSGDLLDVHTFLFVLGSRMYEGATWGYAVTPAMVGDLARELDVGSPTIHDGHLKAAALVRDKYLDLSRPDDPLHALTLDQYGYGIPQSFCWVLEQATKDYIRMSLGNSSAHEVGKTAKGTWRLGAEEGYSHAEAEEHFERTVKPRLRELAAAASAFVRGAPPPTITAGKLMSYRQIDAKTFCLLVSALDYDVARARLVGVLDPTRLWSLGILVGAEPLPIYAFADYFEAQRRLGDALDRLPAERRPSANALGKWSYTDPGKVLCGFIEPVKATEPTENGELDELAVAVAAVESESGSSAEPAKPAPPIPDDLPDWEAFLEALDDDLRPTARLLQRRKNVVLYGPPGTGKTHASIRLARAWRQWQRDDAQNEETAVVEQVTFHPSYGYEDFVEAFRPHPADPGRFVLTKGLLPRLAEKAKKAPQASYLLLIDELNRGDVARILGELVTLLEHDKRSPEHARRRMISGEPLWLPPNVFVLGTMNTADKSVSFLDIAVRRRFAFILTPPRPDLLNDANGAVEKVRSIKLSDLLTALNRRLLGIGVLPDRLLGHALLWIPKADTDERVEAVAERLRWDILPLVEEYCFSDRRQMKLVLGALVDDHGRPANEIFRSEEAFMQALEDLLQSDVPPVGSP